MTWGECWNDFSGETPNPQVEQWIRRGFLLRQQAASRLRGPRDRQKPTAGRVYQPETLRFKFASNAITMPFMPVTTIDSHIFSPRPRRSS